jgi:hypothetical protein
MTNFGTSNLYQLYFSFLSSIKKYSSITDYYDDFPPAQQEFASPIIAALEDFGIAKLQWNMPVYYKDNIIKRPTKNESRRYFGIKGK